jgi:hypothetical protein
MKKDSSSSSNAWSAEQIANLRKMTDSELTEPANAALEKLSEEELSLDPALRRAQTRIFLREQY